MWIPKTGWNYGEFRPAKAVSYGFISSVHGKDIVKLKQKKPWRTTIWRPFIMRMMKKK